MRNFVVIAALILLLCSSNSTYGQSKDKKKLVPTITIPAPEGSKGFGMPPSSSDSTKPPRPRRRWVSPSVKEQREIVTIEFDDLIMSDPFIYPDEKTKTYYLTSSGGNIYKSKNLKSWEGPYGAFDATGTWMDGLPFVAAAEIHEVNGKYYYAATWTDRNDLVDVVPRRYNVHRNQTQILVSDNPGGPYKRLNPDPEYDYLYHDWDVIDGTIWYEDGTPYFIFVHEWTQIIDGTMEYVILSPDLSERISDPVCIFRASEASWALEMVGNGEMTFGLKLPGWVTDGPQMFRTQTGKLGMLWSTWGAKRYLQGVAYSESGTIDGPWIQEEVPFKDDNSGHGMLFTTFEGKLLFLVHHVEGDGPRKPQFYEVDDSGDKLILGKRYHP